MFKIKIKSHSDEVTCLYNKKILMQTVIILVLQLGFYFQKRSELLSTNSFKIV